MRAACHAGLPASSCHPARTLPVPALLACIRTTFCCFDVPPPPTFSPSLPAVAFSFAPRRPTAMQARGFATLGGREDGGVPSAQGATAAADNSAAAAGASLNITTMM